MSTREQGPSLLSGPFVWLALIALALSCIGGLGFLGQTIARALFTSSVSCRNSDGTLVARCKLERSFLFFGGPGAGRNVLEFSRPGPPERQPALTFTLPMRPAHLKGMSFNPAGDVLAVDMVRTGDQARVLGVFDLRGLSRELGESLGATGRETRSAVYRERLETAIRMRYSEVAYPAPWAAVMAKLPAVPAPVRPQTPRSPRGIESYEVPPAGPGVSSATPEDLADRLARAASGSIIVLKPGTYPQCPPIPAGVALLSESPHQAVFRQGMALGSNVQLAGLRFLDMDGPAISATNAHSVRIEQCWFDEIYGGAAIALQDCRRSVINGNIVTGVFCSDRGDAVGLSISGGSAELSANVVSEISEDGHGDAAGIRVENAASEISRNVVAHVRERAWGSARGIECRGDGQSRTVNNTLVNLSGTDWDEATGICYAGQHDGVIAGNAIDRIEGYGWNGQYRVEAIFCQAGSVAVGSNVMGRVEDTDKSVRTRSGSMAGRELPFLDFAGGDLRLPPPAGDTFGAYATAPASLTDSGVPDELEIKPYEGEAALLALREFIDYDFEAQAPAPVLHVSASAGEEQDGSRERPFRSLQAALGKAGPGCTILIGPGMFFEGDLNLPQGVSLRGAGRRRTVLCGALSIASDSTVASLTLRGSRDTLVETRGTGVRLVDVEVWPTRNTRTGIASHGEIDVIGCHIHGIRDTGEWRSGACAIVATGARAHIRGTVISDVRKQQWASGLVAVGLRADNVLVERCVFHDVINRHGDTSVVSCSPGASTVIRNNTIWRCGARGGGSAVGVRVQPPQKSPAAIEVRGNLTGGLFAQGRFSAGTNLVCDAAADNLDYPRITIPAGVERDADTTLTLPPGNGPAFLDPRSGDFRIRPDDPAAACGAYAPVEFSSAEHSGRLDESARLW